MATPGVAVPGTVVPPGSAVSPGGAQGIQGIQGPAGGGGTGTGTKTWKKWFPSQGNPSATNYAVWGTRNNNPFLAFNDTTAWSTFLLDVVPEGAVVASGVTVNILWAAATATTGNVKWNVQIDNMTAGSVASDSYDTLGTVTSACNATNGNPTLSSISPLTTIDSIAIGNTYRLLVTRDAANAADTMVGDAQIYSVEIRSAN
jgi:hypothetical protein